MAIVRPFKAIRPTRDNVHLFASRSYLTYSDEALKEKLEDNPFTFLHIINPEYKKKNKKIYFFFFLLPPLTILAIETSPFLSIK